MKRSERFVCPPPGEDKRRYLWWARRVLEECDAAVARISGGTAQPVIVDLPNVPGHGVAYLINEFHACSRYSLLRCSRRFDADKYEIGFISPVNSEVFLATEYEFPHSFGTEAKAARYVYGGKNDQVYR